jgi:hypothetical protein
MLQVMGAGVNEAEMVLTWVLWLWFQGVGAWSCALSVGLYPTGKVMLVAGKGQWLIGAVGFGRLGFVQR